MIAAVLYLHKHPRQAVLKSFEQMRRHLAHGHDVGHCDFFAARDAECWRIEGGARVAPCFAAHLVVIADDAIDLGHVGEHFGLGFAPRSR